MTAGEYIGDLLIWLAKKGPAAGIVLVLATQRPDSQTIPSGLRAVLGSRFALRLDAEDPLMTLTGQGCGLQSERGQEPDAQLRGGLPLGEDRPGPVHSCGSGASECGMPLAEDEEPARGAGSRTAVRLSGDR